MPKIARINETLISQFGIQCNLTSAILPEVEGHMQNSRLNEMSFPATRLLGG